MTLIGRRIVGSVRVRVTATALLALACALAVAALVIHIDLQHDRLRILMDTAQEDAREVVAFNPDLSTPLMLPPDATIDSGLVQVINSQGHVIGFSRPLRHLPALWEPGDPQVQPATDLLGDLAKDVQEVSVPVQTNGVKAHVVVVASMAQFDHTVADVQGLLEIGSPMLLAVLGIISWLVTGRALRPIELMRREVAGVATVRGRAEHHRVAEPAHDDEVGRLARTLNSMLDRMEASTARERRFVSDASHELRSPIANIRTELEVALHHPDTSNWWQVAADVLAQNQRMEQLVASLLLLARSDEGSLIESGDATDLTAVARAVASEVPPGPPAVRVVAPEGGPPPLVRVPVVYAERMVANLVDNARRFAATDVTVTLAVTSDEGDGETGRWAVLTVTDDGPGVAGEHRQRIFERFVRLDEARDRGEGGFGLGLAIVADLSRFYGGSIHVSAGEGPVGRPGAQFVLKLPVSAPAPETPAPATSAPSTPPIAPAPV